MEEKNSFEKWVVALAMGGLYMWFRPFVALALWRTHIMPMGAPAVEFWWMFWALFACAAVSGVSSDDKGLTHAMTSMVGSMILLLCVWTWMT